MKEIFNDPEISLGPTSLISLDAGLASPDGKRCLQSDGSGPAAMPSLRVMASKFCKSYAILAGAALSVASFISFPTPASAQFIPASSTSVEAPGPSQALFNAPFYSCSRNFYVSTTGNDSNPGTSAAPWKTLQRADVAAHGRIGGDCVNVAPGTYANGINITHGGNAATPTGYVVYRCQVMDKCKITATGGNGVPAFTMINSGSGPNYIVIDGFELAAAKKVAYGAGIFTNNNVYGAPTGTPSVHHLWALNNIVHGYGQAGINTNESDWVYVLHNTTYDNANVTCDAQGSGIGIVVAKATPNYTLTTMDKTYAPYHQIISWNVSYNNILTQCGTASNPYDTDGNGIIMDTFNGSGVDNVLYPNQTLVANNVTYNNGGRGVEIFRSSYVTVSNNTAYNNNLDPFNSGFPRGEIHEAGGVQNVFTNNVAIAIPAASTADPRCKGASYDIAPAPCPLMANVPLLGGSAAGVTDANNTWTTNVTYGGNPPWGWGPNGNAIISPDTMSCTSNKCNVNPSLVGASSFNFALTAQSPAIGYGAAKPYLATSAVDAGACYHSLTKCP